MLKNKNGNEFSSSFKKANQTPEFFPQKTKSHTTPLGILPFLSGIRGTKKPGSKSA